MLQNGYDMLVLHYLSIIFLSIVPPVVSAFTPDTSSFDAYGLKLAVNDVLLVESHPSQSTFALRLAPYNYSLSCTLAYNDSNQYVYAVAVQRQMTTDTSIRFVFIGMDIKTDVPFIGSLTYMGIRGDTYVTTTRLTRKTVFPCDGWQKSNYQIHQLEQFGSSESVDSLNDDFFVVTVGPTGHFAYGFAQSFLVVYNLDTDNVSTQLGNITWPDPSFLPRGVDVSNDSLFVVLGYTGDPNTQYTPCAYLLNITNSTLYVLDTWLYTPPSSSSWQASLTNWDADIYTARYDMSVSMNNDKNQVLLGIQIVNTIVLLDIDRTTNTFRLSPQTLSNRKSIGMGKAVGWLDRDLAVVLVNTYSFNYVWSSSQIFVYNASVPNKFVIMAILPNTQQILVPALGPEFLSLFITQTGTVVILDSDGDYYILLPSPVGSFSDSSSRSSSSSKPCIAGTYNSQSNILPCSLCPSGTTTDGLIGQSSCVPCDNETFCSLGAVSRNISLFSPLFTDTNQVFAYPESPQSIRFDNILIQNILVIHVGSSRHCVLISPLFWSLIVILFGIIIWLLMLLFKRYVKNPYGEKTRERVKKILKKTDLIGEGEMVIGGLFSFAIIVLCVCAYTFSYAYFHRYPIEEIKDNASFACDPTLSNIQFNSGLMTTGIPPNDIEEPIFTLLNNQPLTLSIEFINTLFKCTDITATQIKDTNLDMTISTCTDTDDTVSISLLLPAHGLSMQILLADTNTIGSLRMRLEGPGIEEENDILEASYKLLDLDFAKSFYESGHILAQQPSCTLQLTKVINQTYPLSEHGETQFSAIWLPSFSANLDQMFIDGSEYLHATSSNTVLSIVISETPYYMLNIQKPITDEAELIFTNLLFTIVCLEIFGLGFLICKLLILPLFGHILDCCRRKILKNEFTKANFDFPDTSTCRL